MHVTETGTGEGAIIRLLLEGTAAQTGTPFFEALVKNLAQALKVAGAWVTEYVSGPERLRALAFWFAGRYVKGYEYAIRGTPCEPVIRGGCLVHFPENIVMLFPQDPDLKTYGAVSYMGVPLLDVDNSVLGHLAVLDTKPMPLAPRLNSLFRIFAARAAAELQRLRAESQVREREEKLVRLFDSAMDAIVEFDRRFTITRVNRSAVSTFGCEPGQIAGANLGQFLAPESAHKLERLITELEGRPEDRQYLWIPGGLKALRGGKEPFPAEASLSRFEAGGESFYTLILRNVHDQLATERKIESLETESAYLREEIQELHNFRELLGESPAMRAVINSIRQVAPVDTTVLLLGETGTGKELAARAIHAASRRAARPLIKVNCAAVPAALMESEFFGHEKGAFTGATQRRAGRFALADGGTIFLDEIGELPLELQPKLLRVLQEGEFEPVGASVPRRVDVRVIAATNRDLQRSVQEGRFREDLYYRLNVFPIVLPPLREREGDVELLAVNLVERLSQRLGRPAQPLSSDGLRRLRAYGWPGNVRELQNVLERAILIARDGRLDLASLLPFMSESTPAPPPAGGPEPIRTARELAALESENLLRALEKTGWRISGPNGAATLLGMPPSTLGSRLKALGIKRRP
jgi:PAS domain S-box-containing protein